MGASNLLPIQQPGVGQWSVPSSTFPVPLPTWRCWLDGAVKDAGCVGLSLICGRG